MWPPCPSLFTLIVADDGSPWWWTISRQLLRCPQSRMGDRGVKWLTWAVGCLLGKRGFVLDLWHLLSCDPHNPHLASTHHSYPHQLPVTPHHSPASACHVLGVKGFPPIAHQKGTPPSPARALNHNQSLGRQRWIGTSATLYLSGRPPPSTGLLSRTNNRGDSSRSVRVKSAGPGRKLSQSNGGKFFSPYEQESQCQTACLTEGRESFNTKKWLYLKSI